MKTLMRPKNKNLINDIIRIDVLEEENSDFELNKNSKDLNFLSTCDKVILTPHVAGLTYESDERISEVLFKKIVKILKQN